MQYLTMDAPNRRKNSSPSCLTKYFVVSFIFILILFLLEKISMTTNQIDIEENVINLSKNRDLPLEENNFETIKINMNNEEDGLKEYEDYEEIIKADREQVDLIKANLPSEDVDGNFEITEDTKRSETEILFSKKASDEVLVTYKVPAEQVEDKASEKSEVDVQPIELSDKDKYEVYSNQKVSDSNQKTGSKLLDVLLSGRKNEEKEEVDLEDIVKAEVGEDELVNIKKVDQENHQDQKFEDQPENVGPKQVEEVLNNQDANNGYYDYLPKKVEQAAVSPEEENADEKSVYLEHSENANSGEPITENDKYQNSKEDVEPKDDQPHQAESAFEPVDFENHGYFDKVEKIDQEQPVKEPEDDEKSGGSSEEKTERIEPDDFLSDDETPEPENASKFLDDQNKRPVDQPKLWF